MKTILINLPSPALAEPWSNFPLGLGYVAAALEKRGINIGIFDSCNGLPESGEIPKADIYGLSVTTPQFHSAIHTAKLIKSKYPRSIIVAGGPHTELHSDDILSSGYFNSVVIGEGEFSFYELIRDYELTGELDKIYSNPPIKLLDDIPFPARHLLPNFKAKALMTHALLKGDYVDGGQTTIIASRGCPFQCSFCAPHSRKVRFRSISNTISEIKDIGERFEIRQFKWQDDTFTLNRKWVFALCRELEKLNTYHRVHTRVDTFDHNIAKALYKGGVRLVCFGIESFSQKILDRNSKGITVDQIENALRIASNNNLKTVGFLIFGMPGESRKTVDETKSGIIRNRPYIDYLNLATMVPMPGSPVYKNPELFDCEIIEDNFSKYWIVDHEISDIIIVKSRNVRLKDMQNLKREMYDFIRDEGYSRPEWKN